MLLTFSHKYNETTAAQTLLRFTSFYLVPLPLIIQCLLPPWRIFFSCRLTPSRSFFFFCYSESRTLVWASKHTHARSLYIKDRNSPPAPKHALKSTRLLINCSCVCSLCFLTGFNVLLSLKAFRYQSCWMSPSRSVKALLQTWGQPGLLHSSL